MAKSKFDKKEKRKGRSKATVKSDKSKAAKAKAPKSTTSAVAAPVLNQHGTAQIAVREAARFTIETSKRAKPEGPTLWIVDRLTNKRIEWFWDSPRVCDAIQMLLVRLHEVCGTTPIALMPSPEQQVVGNILAAIKAVAVAML